MFWYWIEGVSPFVCSQDDVEGGEGDYNEEKRPGEGRKIDAGH